MSSCNYTEQCTCNLFVVCAGNDVRLWCSDIALYEGFPIYRNQHGHLLFHSARMDPAVWYFSTIFRPKEQLSKAHTGENKQIDVPTNCCMAATTPVGKASFSFPQRIYHTVPLPKCKEFQCILTFRGMPDAAMAPVYAVPTVHVEDLSRDLWSWASVKMINGEETLTR